MTIDSGFSEKPLRVLHVVSLVSGSGAYGGPSAVALEQAQALVKRGHEITLLAGERRSDRIANTPPAWMRRYRVRRVMPTPGFTGLLGLRLTAAVFRSVRASDVVHVQFTRELIPVITLWLAKAQRKPIVIQCHGMVAVPKNRAIRFVDYVFFRRTLGFASHVFVYPGHELEGIELVAQRRLPSSTLTNGAAQPTPEALRAEMSDLDLLEATKGRILFAARLHPRKRVALFLDAALRLYVERPQLRFAVIGPDGGDAREVTQFIIDHPEIPLNYIAGMSPVNLNGCLRAASIYVLPSANEPFPVTVLEAITRSTPVVVSDTCGVAPAVESSGAGTVFRTDDLDDLVAKMAILLDDDGRRAQAGAAALALSKAEFSWDRVAATLELTYFRLVNA